MGEVKRSARVSGRLREEMARILREMRDPRLAGVLVSRVELTDDIRFARIFVRHELGLPEGAEGEASRKAILKGLDAASGRIRREVTRALQVRHAPELRFAYDEAPDEIARIEELLREVKREGGS